MEHLEMPKYLSALNLEQAQRSKDYFLRSNASRGCVQQLSCVALVMCFDCYYLLLCGFNTQLGFWMHLLAVGRWWRSQEEMICCHTVCSLTAALMWDPCHPDVISGVVLLLVNWVLMGLCYTFLAVSKGSLQQRSSSEAFSGRDINSSWSGVVCCVPEKDTTCAFLLCRNDPGQANAILALCRASADFWVAV